MDPLVFTLAKIENIMQQVTFDPQEMKGKIVTNTITVKRDFLEDVLLILYDTIANGLAVSPHIKIESVGQNTRILTACSITIDGVLLKQGIPVRPKGGGIIEVVDRLPMRFTDMLLYWATTIDPIDILMSQELTSVRKMMETGSGRILGNLREAPMLAREQIEDVLELLKTSDFAGVLELGEPNMDVLGVPVERDHMGIALVGGTNIVAAALESGMEISTQSISGLTDVGEMRHIEDAF